LLSLLLARQSLENIVAMLRLFGGIAHFSKFYPTGHSVEPNHICFLLLFGVEASSVVFKKTACRIVWEFWHLGGDPNLTSMFAYDVFLKTEFNGAASKHNSEQFLELINSF
jgi:hypothetical protein